LPEGHTWKSFVKFLLKTLPKDTSENFKQRFIQSLRYWARVGRGLPDRVIAELEKYNVNFRINGYTPHGSGKLRRVAISKIPDHLDFLSAHCSDVTSWKRFAITILKNDHTCKYMGLQPPKDQQERQKAIQKKYSRL